MQVTHVALQTDSCDTLYITKNMLTAYTIAIVQNAQALQYDQMHIALQMARNQASLETPLRAEELMTAHFNLAVLSNETDINKTPDAQKHEATILDTELSASTVDEETYVKKKRLPLHAEVRSPKCVIYITRNPVTFVIQRCPELFLLDQQAPERNPDTQSTLPCKLRSD